MQKIFFVSFLAFLMAAFAATTVLAAKPRIRRQAQGSAGISYSGVRISRPTHSIAVTFTNLGSVKSNRYTLSYVASGIGQGVVGTMIPSGQATDARDLYVGTCSKGVCTPHYNIQGMSLLVETTLTSGGTYAKRYRIKF